MNHTEQLSSSSIQAAFWLSTNTKIFMLIRVQRTNVSRIIWFLILWKISKNNCYRETKMKLSKWGQETWKEHSTVEQQAQNSFKERAFWRSPHLLIYLYIDYFYANAGRQWIKSKTVCKFQWIPISIQVKTAQVCRQTTCHRINIHLYLLCTTKRSSPMQESINEWNMQRS